MLTSCVANAATVCWLSSYRVVIRASRLCSYNAWTTEYYASQRSLKVAKLSILINIDPDQVGIKESG
jgi:hypothetical protein